MSFKDDPAKAEFWNVRFRRNTMPWDARSSPVDLNNYLSSQKNETGRVLIPGCGSAYEVRTFAEHGHDVIAVDYAQAAVERARGIVGELQNLVIFGDFFTYDFGAPPFQIIYERAFLASLPKNLWADYVERVANLLAPGGKLLGFFVYGDSQGGPPFCLRDNELTELLGDKFEKVSDIPATESVPVFQGKERWEVWVRKSR